MRDKGVGLFTVSREQCYNAAVTIYLAAYTYSLLAVAERSRVDEQVYAAMGGSLVGFSPIEFQRMWPQAMKSAWRAYAMSDLGIPPAIEGEVWRLPKSRCMLWEFKTGPSKLFSAYRSYDQATARAKSDLESKGLDLWGLDLSARYPPASWRRAQ
jgi:hypothetical protein